MLDRERMMEEKTNPREKLSAEEKAAITRDLFERYRRGETTAEENEVIESLEEKFIPDKEFEVSDSLLRELDNETREFIHEQTGVQIEKSRQIGKSRGVKKRTLSPPLLTGSIAGIVLLLVGLFALYRNHSPGDTRPRDLSIAPTSMQYISGNAVENILLPDGSRATLNTGTTLNTREGSMNDATREIWLEEGEVFFDIEPDEKRPFVVHLRGGLTVQVLGTSFNIQAYGELPFQEIAVVTGRVKVEAPGNKETEVGVKQRAVYREETNTLSVTAANSEQKTAWREGNVVLEDASLDELRFRIHQLYGKELIFDHVPGIISINTTFNRETLPEDVFEEIAALYHLSYKVTGEKVIFTPKTTE